MEELTSNYKAGPGKIVICSWCKGSVVHRQLRRHFMGDCSAIPKFPDWHQPCTRCQSIKPLDEFSNRTHRSRGKSNTCKTCNNLKQNSVRVPKPRQIPPHLRPGRWVLKPCIHCGEQFNVRQMLKHIPRCPNNKTGYGPKIEYEPIAGMEAIRKASLNGAVLARQKNWNLQRSYGIGIDDYNRMVAAQEGRCAICKRLPTQAHRAARSLHVDHDHETGVVRGLLCNNCNHLVGNCREKIEVLEAAIEYLRRYCESGSHSIYTMLTAGSDAS